MTISIASTDSPKFVDVEVRPEIREALFELGRGWNSPAIDNVERAFRDADRARAFLVVDRLSSMLKLLELGRDRDGIPVTVRVDAAMVRFLHDAMTYCRESADFDFSGDRATLLLDDAGAAACSACEELRASAETSAGESLWLWVIERYFAANAPGRAIDDAMEDGNTSPNVTMDRVTRDGIVLAIRDSFDGLMDPPDFTSPETARGALAEFTMAVRVLDSLGWEEHGDHETYELDVDETLRKWLERRIKLYPAEEDEESAWSDDFEPKRAAMVAAMTTVLALSRPPASMEFTRADLDALPVWEMDDMITEGNWAGVIENSTIAVEALTGLIALAEAKMAAAETSPPEPILENKD